MGIHKLFGEKKSMTCPLDPRYLAVLIAYQLTAKSQVGVDYRGQNTVKFVQNEKYSSKRSDFLRFYLYLCHVIDDFACLELQH